MQRNTHGLQWKVLASPAAQSDNGRWFVIGPSSSKADVLETRQGPRRSKRSTVLVETLGVCLCPRLEQRASKSGVYSDDLRLDIKVS